MQEARRLLSNTGIKLTTDGQRHFEVAIGTSNFRAQYDAESHEMGQLMSCRLCKNTTTCSLFSIYTWYLKSIYLHYENDIRHARIHKTC